MLKKILIIANITHFIIILINKHKCQGSIFYFIYLFFFKFIYKYYFELYYQMKCIIIIFKLVNSELLYQGKAKKKTKFALLFCLRAS